MSNVLKLKDDTQDIINMIDEMCVPCGSSNKTFTILNLPRTLFNDVSKIERSVINRDEWLRLKRVGFLKHHLPTHDKIALYIIREQLVVKIPETGEEITIKPGIYLSNGNTRRLCYSENPKYMPKTDPIADVYDVDDPQQFLDIYYTYDSSDSQENTPHKIQGAISLLGLNVNSTKAKSGGFSSALDIAYGDKTVSAIGKVASFKEEIELIDDVGIFDATKNLQFQTLYATCLIAAKHWNGPEKQKLRMISGLQFIAQAKSDGMTLDGDKWDGLTAMCYEIFHPGEKNWIPEGMLKKTSFVTQKPQMNFFLYCFGKYMASQKIDKTIGFKPSNWQTTFDDIMNLMSQKLI